MTFAIPERRHAGPAPCQRVQVRDERQQQARFVPYLLAFARTFALDRSVADLHEIVAV